MNELDYAKIKNKMYKTWMKILKASIKKKTRKVAELESKLIQLEWKYGELDDGK